MAQAIFDKKGANIIALDIHAISTLTEYYLIAEGNVARHTMAIAKHLIETLKEIGYAPYIVEGIDKGDWIVIDYGDIVVHLFDPDLREKYGLEKLWNKGSIVDLNIIVPKEIHE